jgi:hypothetical protein
MAIPSKALRYECKRVYSIRFLVDAAFTCLRVHMIRNLGPAVVGSVAVTTVFIDPMSANDEF